MGLESEVVNTYYDNDETIWTSYLEELYDDATVAGYYMAILGEDRGMRLNITNSTFKNSNFCAGMVLYMK